MTAREKFSKGDRVRLTKTALEGGIGRSDRLGWTGTVVGFCKENDCVRVITDNRRHGTAFHIDFWERNP